MTWMMLSLFGTANAADDLVIGSGASGTYTCEVGQKVKVEGNKLTLTFDGDCGALEVIGNGNAITIDGVSSVRLTGNKNRTTWKRNLSGQRTLPVTKLGTGNQVTQAQ
jgi:hypothetical protein